MRIFVFAALVLAASGAAQAQTSTAPHWPASAARSAVPAPSAGAQALSHASTARCGDAAEPGGDAITRTQIAPGTVHRPADPARDQQRAYTDLADNAARSASAFAQDNTTESSGRDQLGDAPPC